MHVWMFRFQKKFLGRGHSRGCDPQTNSSLQLCVPSPIPVCIRTSATNRACWLRCFQVPLSSVWHTAAFVFVVGRMSAVQRTSCTITPCLSTELWLMVVQSDSVSLQGKMDLGPLVHVADLPGRRALCSAGSNHLVPPVKLSTVGSRAFLVAAAQLFNSYLSAVVSFRLQVLRSGTAYQMMSPPLRPCQPSGAIWRHTYSAAVTTLSDSAVLWLWWSSWWHCCLGHSKNTMWWWWWWWWWRRHHAGWFTADFQHQMSAVLPRWTVAPSYLGHCRITDWLIDWFDKCLSVEVIQFCSLSWNFSIKMRIRSLKSTEIPEVMVVEIHKSSLFWKSH